MHPQTTEEFGLTRISDDEVPPYAVLSLPWFGGERVAYAELVAGSHKREFDAAELFEQITPLSLRAESTIPGLTLPGSHNNFTIGENSFGTRQPLVISVYNDEDYASVECNDENIASKTVTSITRPGILDVRYIGTLFAELEELRPLHEEALRIFGKKHFQKNYRRVFKHYVLRLLNEAQLAIEKDTVKMLMSRTNRINIVQRILTVIENKEENASESSARLTHQPVGILSLEDCARHADASGSTGTIMSGNIDVEGQEQSENESADDSVDEDGHHFERVAFLNIDQANTFLRKGMPFKMLANDLRLMVLPTEIQEVMEEDSKRSIKISTVNDLSITNRLKALIERYSAFDWDWWPLSPCVPDLLPGRVRLDWTFCGRRLFKMITPKEAKLVQRILELIKDCPATYTDCEVKPSQVNLITTIPYITEAILVIFRSFYSVLATDNPPSRAQQLYTPADAAPADTSTASRHSTNKAGAPELPATAASGGGMQNTVADPTVAPPGMRQDFAWVIFGVKNYQDLDKIENICTSASTSDSAFFQDLKIRHAKHCWFFQRWFSPFHFQYCNFVQFETVGIDQVYSCGDALPDDHGYANQYDYEPRPPRAKNPLIEPKLFSIYLKACSTPCFWALLPSFLHKCYPIPLNSHKWKRILKKRNAFDVKNGQSEDIAFGLEANYSLSFATVAVYHLLLIIPAFGFWIYWLIIHHGDLQNASVPTLTVLAFIGAFWASIGKNRNPS